MGTNYGPELLGGSTPDTSGKAWWEPYEILATNDKWKLDILRVDEDINNNAQLSTKVVFARGSFRVPADYVSNAKIVIQWTSTKTTGDIYFGADLRTVGGDGTTSLDQATAEESVNVTDSMAATAHFRMEATLTLTGGNYSPGETVEFELFMDGTQGADTLAGARILFSAFFCYDNV